MESVDSTGTNRLARGAEPGIEAPAAGPIDGSPRFGPNAGQILATEHWSLLATRSLIWNEALSRASVFPSPPWWPLGSSYSSRSGAGCT